ncbi:hypothetical protein BDV29DRAFT_165563 [Aspergillus leporis]|jgi:hypothetical protein|uniref:Cytochrome P450 n=1 Tax=Aspergillus leporis TaxID=41062 RepID=A0A5N5XE02_9EURO|nr:hypothetical protein BDV29DRAFT_165563 [Aspergillus leporis]
MDLVIAEYMKTRPAGPTIDPHFETWAIIQIRLFLFVAHDSKAVTIVYCLYLLSKHPAALARIRAEHDEIFGPDVSSAAELLKQRPELINHLSYTLAVMKETPRLSFHPQMALEVVYRTQLLRDQTVECCLRKSLQFGLCTAPSIAALCIGRTQILSSPTAGLLELIIPCIPQPGDLEAFEQGPRDCVGQKIALLEVKITLLMVVREFDFKGQYVAWDHLHPSHGPNTMFGERCLPHPKRIRSSSSGVSL